MFSRRGFLKSSSLAVTAGAILPAVAQAAENEKSLSPAIAALTTRRAEAKPITVEERAIVRKKPGS